MTEVKHFHGQREEIMSERPFDSVRFTEMAREGWNAAAMGGKTWAPTIEKGGQMVNDRLVDLAGLTPGQKVLDIAIGYGEPMVTAAKRVGSTGQVVATDLSPAMLDLAKERASELGLQHIEFYACNGETLGVSHLLHTLRPSHLRSFLYKICNVQGEVLNRLIDLNIVLPGFGRPDPVMIFLKPSKQPHPGL